MILFFSRTFIFQKSQWIDLSLTLFRGFVTSVYHLILTFQGQEGFWGHLVPLHSTGGPQYPQGIGFKTFGYQNPGMLKSLSRPSVTMGSASGIWRADCTCARSWSLASSFAALPAVLCKGPPASSLLPFCLERTLCALSHGSHSARRTRPVSVLHSPCSPCLLPRYRSPLLGFLLDLKQKMSQRPFHPPPHHLPPFSTVTCTLLSLAKNLSWEWWVSSLRIAWLYQPSALHHVSVMGTAFILTLFL